MNPHDTLYRAGNEGPPRLELRGRIVAALTFAGVTILAISIAGAVMLEGMSAEVARMVEGVSERTMLVARIKQEFLLMRVAEKNFIIADNSRDMEEYARRIAANESQMVELLARLDAENEGSVRERLVEFRQGFEEFRGQRDRMMELSRTDTVARAAELSQSDGRAIFERGRDALLDLIERTRLTIARSAGSGVAGIDVMTERVGVARDCLERLHDLQYEEQALIAVTNPDRRTVFAASLDERESAIRRSAAELVNSPEPSDRDDASRFLGALDEWAMNSREVRRLALADSKAQAMTVSTGAVRDAYMRSSQVLDSIIDGDAQSARAMLVSHERTGSLSSMLLLVTGLMGIAVIGLSAWLVVRHVTREIRAAVEVLLRSE